MAARRLMSSAMRSKDLIDCLVLSVMSSFHDLRGLPLRRYYPLLLGEWYGFRQRIETADMAET